MTNQSAQPRVLVVDDEESIRYLLYEFLLSQNYDCTAVDSGRAALDRLERESFNIMLCDINMPGMTGLEVLDEVRRRDLPLMVILVSALHDTRRAVSAMRLGAYDYIVKPFQLDEVELSIKRALEHQRLVRENREYQTSLEKMVATRTRQLERVNADLREKSLHLEMTVEELYRTYRYTLSALAAALDLRDNETKGHAERVVAYSLRIGQELGLDDAAMIALEHGALLHDVGKIGVRDAILLKPGKLTPEEWVEMRLHIAHGENIVQQIPFLHGALPVVSQHHEFYDGSGYPRGLKGEEIHLNARIFSVADTLDAMTSDRPYRRALTFERAQDEVRRFAGKQYDPRVVEAFLNVPLAEWRRIRERIDEMHSLDLDYIPDFQTFDLWQVLAR